MNHELDINAFFALVRAGLWKKDVRLSQYGKVDFEDVLRLASEQAVVGLVATALEHVTDVIIPKMAALHFAGTTLQLEQRNKAMNSFIAETVEGMRKEGINTLLVKGQGIAQCYENPLWRTSGDIDFFLSEENYQKAKTYLAPLSSRGKPERRYSKEIGFYIDQWLIELHGTLHSGLSTRVDKLIDEVQKAVFKGGKVRTWMNGRTQVLLPAADEDVFFVFTHFVKHFFKEGGVTLRQMCDWSRLLFCYRDKLDLRVLESRIRRTGLISEWRAFASLAVDYLGMPVDAMPLYSEDEKWRKKAFGIVAFILKGGEWRKWRDTMAVAQIFPWSTLKFAPGILLNVNWMKVKERFLGSFTLTLKRRRNG